VCGLNRGSCCRAAGAGIVNDILEKARKNNVTIHFPVDYVTGNKWGEDCEVSSATDETGIPDGWQGYDCGPRSSAIFAEAIGRANTIIWNGYPSSSSLLLFLFLLAHSLAHISLEEDLLLLLTSPMGVFEFANFSAGTRAVMDAVVAAHERGAVAIIGMYQRAISEWESVTSCSLYFVVKVAVILLRAPRCMVLRTRSIMSVPVVVSLSSSWKVREIVSLQAFVASTHSLTHSLSLFCCVSRSGKKLPGVEALTVV